MKKLVAALTITLLVIVGCQEASSIVAPNSDTKIEKKSEGNQFLPSDQDSIDLPDAPGRPIIVRV